MSGHSMTLSGMNHEKSHSATGLAQQKAFPKLKGIRVGDFLIIIKVTKGDAGVGERRQTKPPRARPWACQPQHRQIPTILQAYGDGLNRAIQDLRDTLRVRYKASEVPAGLSSGRLFPQTSALNCCLYCNV